MKSDVAPPTLAERLLARAVPPGLVGQTILGDAREEFAAQVTERGALKARLWYWKHAVTVVLALVPDQVTSSRWNWGMFLSTATVEARHTFRSMIRQPAHLTIAIGTLALGIAGVTGMMSVTNGVLLAPLPYEADGEIVLLWNNGKTARPTFDVRYPVSFDQVREFTAATTTAKAVAWVSRRTDEALDRGGVLESVPIGEGSWNLFDFLGVGATLGRLYGAADVGASEQVVVLSDAVWRTRFGGDPEIVGTSVTIAGSPRRILGVLPPEFRWFLRGDGDAADFWIPPMSEPLTFYDYWLLARPNTGANMEDLRAEFAPNAWEYFTNPAYKDTFTIPEAATADQLRTHVLGYAATRIPLLLAAVGLVLVLACLSVAHLLLGRLGERESEFAMRRALGASRGRLVVSILFETSALVVTATSLGVLLTQWGLGVVRAAAPPGIPRLDTVTLEPAIAAGVVSTMVLVLVAVSVIPVWFVSRLTATRVFASRRATHGVRVTRTRHLLIGSQVACAVLVLLASSLVLRSWYALISEDLGFETAAVLAGQFHMPADGWEEAPFTARSQTDGSTRTVFQGTPRLHADLQELETELKAIPGVESVAISRYVPLSGTYGWWSPVTIEGWEDRAWDELEFGTSSNWVSASYFDVLGVRPLRGRLFQTEDVAPGAPPVVVVSDFFAKRFWPDDDALGKRFYVYGVWVSGSGEAESGRRLAEVVGVVPTLREADLKEENATVFLPFQGSLYTTRTPNRAAAFVMRTAVDPGTIVDQARDVVATVLPDDPVTNVEPLHAVANWWKREPTFFTWLITVFGCYALLLSLVGIAGVVGFHVTRRSREVGVRMALGASKRDVLRLLAADVGTAVTLGLMAGLVSAAGLSGMLDAWLYETSRFDPLTFLGVPSLFLMAALAATWLPARHAMAVEPAQALREG